MTPPTSPAPEKKKGKKAKGKEQEEPKGLNDQFQAQLDALGIGDSLKLADSYDNDVKVHSTGFPGMDMAISEVNPCNRGLPASRHSEWFSENEHSGKTSALIAIGITWQMMGLRVGIIDIEPSITKQYLKDLGAIVSKDDAEARGLYAMRLLQPEVKPEQCETDMVYLEKVLNIIAAAANVFDLLIVDSVDALVSDLEAEKTADDNDKVGGIAKQMKSFFRKNTTRRAHIAWINHASVAITPGARVKKLYTYGGKALPRYASIRVKLDVIENLREGTDGPYYGFKTRFLLVKNRLGPKLRYIDLTYINGEGFSKQFDYFETALKLGLIKKNGGWFYVPGEGKNEEERKKNTPFKIQGQMNAYYTLSGRSKEELAEDEKAENARIWADIKATIDGESVAADELSEEEKAAIAALIEGGEEETE